jgi:hypothetical protein
MKTTCLLLVLLSSVASAETKKTDVLRWDTFPGPEAVPSVTEGEAFVVSPIQSGKWDGGVSFTLAPVVSAEPHALIVQGPFHRFAVPAAFVAPAVKAQKIGVGAYVLFQKDATLTRTVNVGRVRKVGKDSFTIAYEFVDVETEEVPASHVMLLDGKLAWGAPVSFELDDGKRVLGWYVGPGHEANRAWVVNVGKPLETDAAKVKPLVIRAFKKGAKVVAVVGTTSVLTLKDGKQPPARQYLEPAVVVDVLAGGVQYKVKHGDDGEIDEVSADHVFAR